MNSIDRRSFESDACRTEDLLKQVASNIPIDTEIDGADEILVQLQETFSVIETCNFPSNEKASFLRLVAHLWHKYIDEEGNIERRKRQLNPHTNEREPELNHALKVVQLSFQILKEAHEKIGTLPPEMQRKIIILWNNKFRVLLCSLFHDAIEDGKFTEQSLRELFSQENINPDAQKSVNDVVFLTRPKDSTNYLEDLRTYLLKVERSLFSTFVKGTADIGTNAESPFIGQQLQKFGDTENGYVTFYWKHWKDLNKLSTIQKRMEIIRKNNPQLCEILQTVKKNVQKIIATPSSQRTRVPKHPPFPPLQTGVQSQPAIAQ